METSARITIYLQALGGKFLGPNAFKTDNIQLSLTLKGNTIPILISYHLGPNANDGGIGSSFIYDLPSVEGASSFLPILTPVPGGPSEPAVNYLTPNNLTICGKAKVTITEPTVLGTVSVSIPRPQGPDLVLTESIALNQLQNDYRVIMVVPGLLLEETQPLLPLLPPNSIFVFVKMMCGCPVTTGIPHSYWAASDFLVSAELIYKNGSPERTSLTFTSDATPSVFYAAVENLSFIKQANFTARQKSTGNIGYLTVNY